MFAGGLGTGVFGTLLLLLPPLTQAVKPKATNAGRKKVARFMKALLLKSAAPGGDVRIIMERSTPLA